MKSNEELYCRCAMSHCELLDIGKTDKLYLTYIFHTATCRLQFYCWVFVAVGSVLVGVGSVLVFAILVCDGSVLVCVGSLLVCSGSVFQDGYLC